MRLIRPYTVTDAVMTASDVPENDYPVWSAGTTYALDQMVILTTGVHKIYKSLQAGNVNHNPASSTTWWAEQGSTNKWKFLDRYINSQTTKAGSFSYTFTTTGRVNSLALLNVVATSVRVQSVVAGVGTVYDKTFNMVRTSGINNWWAWLFEEIVRKNDLAITDLPTYLGQVITITITNTAGTAALGVMILGNQKYIGRTQYGSSVGITDYSKKELDAYGSYTILERDYRKRGTFNVMIDNNSLDEVQQLLASYRATPLLYLGVDEYESTYIYGFFEDFSLVIQYFNESQCNLELAGLT